jgi:hypothetical protein
LLYFPYKHLYCFPVNSYSLRQLNLNTEEIVDDVEGEVEEIEEEMVADNEEAMEEASDEEMSETPEEVSGE